MTSAAPAVRSAREPLRVTHEARREPLARPAMSNTVDRHERIALTNRYVEVDGRPAIPVSGELHYSRVPRDEWEERLRLMRAGGITVVATYVFWIHHEPERGQRDFDGDLDVAAFVDAVRRGSASTSSCASARGATARCATAASPTGCRTPRSRTAPTIPPTSRSSTSGSPRSARELAPLCGPASRVIAHPARERALRPARAHRHAQAAGARGTGSPRRSGPRPRGAAPSCPPARCSPSTAATATASGSTPTSRGTRRSASTSSSRTRWDDPGIGADLREHAGIGRHDRRRRGCRRPTSPPRRASSAAAWRPPTTGARCLGALDIAAVAHGKIGNGSAWQGYYMYAGGTNPRARPPGVARDRLPQRPARLRLRLPRPDRRGRRPRAEPRRAAPPARVPRRVRRAARRHAVDAARRAADRRRRRRDAALGDPLRRGIRLGLHQPGSSRTCRSHAYRDARFAIGLDAERRGVPARARRHARRARSRTGRCTSSWAACACAGSRPRRSPCSAPPDRPDARARRRGGHPGRARGRGGVGHGCPGRRRDASVAPGVFAVDADASRESSR